MQQEHNDNTLLDEKALANSLFSEAALSAFEAKQSQVPNEYFEHFENQIMLEVKKSGSSAFILNISKFGKIAIAASLLTIATTAYFFIPSYNKADDIALNINLQDIPTAEIDEYVNSTEIVAEIDWQEEINNESSSLEKLNSHLFKDSNNIQ